MSFNRITDIDIISLSDKDYLSFISRRNKIHEEIKDYVIDRFINIICEQNKEIFELKKKLEKNIKNSLLILKKSLLKNTIFPVYQIDKIDNFLIKNIPNFQQQKNNQKNLRNNANSLFSFNKINLKKYLKPKPNISLNKSNKVNNSHKSNRLLKLSETLDGAHTYRNNSRNYNNKDPTLFSEKKCETFFIENNNKIEPINNYNLFKKNNINCLDRKNNEKKLILSKSKINGINQQNSFFGENNLVKKKINNLRINNINDKNKIRLLYKGMYKNISNNKKNTKKLNCFKKLNLSNIIFNHRNNNNNNNNKSNNTLNYCTERMFKKGDIIKENFFDRNIPVSKINKSVIENYNSINISQSLPSDKKKDFIKLNKIVLTMKEINKLCLGDTHNLTQKTERTRKQLKNNDTHKLNISNNLSMTDRFFKKKKKDVFIIKQKKVMNKENIKKKVDKNKNENCLFNENNYNYNTYKQNSLQTLYNPTFTTFLDRAFNINNGKIIKNQNFVVSNVE